MITLALDASTYTASVAVLRDGRRIVERSVAMKGAHEERLMPAVAQAMEHAGVDVSELGRVVCGGGPGSFTSLRIAGSIAKGIASGVGCALYAVPSLALIVGSAARAPGRYMPVLDALRGDRYVGVYQVDSAGEIAEVQGARVEPAEKVATLAQSAGAVLVGPNEAVVGEPAARAVLHLERFLAGRGPVDIGSWEPDYGRLAEAQVRWEASHGRPLPLT